MADSHFRGSSLAAVLAFTLAAGPIAAQFRPPPRAETEPVIEPKLSSWVERHQCADGRWRSDECDACMATRPAQPCLDSGEAGMDVGVTGLVLLTMLGVGYDDRRPSRVQSAIRNGLEYLARTQDKDGFFGAENGRNAAWCHAIATIAMLDTFSSSRGSRWRRMGLAGIECIRTGRRGAWPWRPGVTPADNDVETAAWSALALAAARTVPDAPVDDIRAVGIEVIARLERAAAMTAPSESREATASAPTSRPAAPVASTAPPELAAAAAFVGRHLLGLVQTEADIAAVTRHLAMIDAHPPSRESAKGTADAQYWYFAALAKAIAESEDSDAFSKWARRLKPLVVEPCRTPGCAFESYDAVDPFMRRAGRSATTAMTTLTLEVYYRYPRAFRNPRR